MSHRLWIEDEANAEGTVYRDSTRWRYVGWHDC